MALTRSWFKSLGDSASHVSLVSTFTLTDDAHLGVTRSLSGPRVSDDNPYSKAQFKTLKYRPGFPHRFPDQDATTVCCRSFFTCVCCRSFFTWYNTEQRHDGIAMLTPETVHYGRAQAPLQRHRRRNSDRSAVVRPSARRPSSRSACHTQLRIDCAEGSNSRARWSGLRPDRTRSTICCRYSGGYRGLDLGIVDTSSSKDVLSTKPGQAHSAVNGSVVAFSYHQGKPQDLPRLCLCSPAVPWNRATTIQDYPYLFGSTQPTSKRIAGPARRIERSRRQS